MRSWLSLVLLVVAGAARAQGPLVAREPFAKAHVTLMARTETRGSRARLADVDVWAEGTRLRATVRGDEGKAAGELWVDGLTSAPLRIAGGKIVDPKPGTLAQGLALSLTASPDLANSKGDRIAGHPCKIITEKVSGYTVTRCIWRGLPLSVEVQGRGFTFNAAATLVEEGAVSVADLQPPAGAPAAPASLSAGR